MEGRATRIVGLALVIVVALSVGLLLSRHDGSASIPPPGSIWFCTSFDAKSFEIRGRADAFVYGARVAFVAHLGQTVPGGYSVTVDIDGHSAPTMAAPPAGMRFYGVTIDPAFLTVGAHYVRVFDIGGNELASGSLTVG